MCGRFTQKSERPKLEIDFLIDDFIFEPVISYNIAPTQKAGIIIKNGSRAYNHFQWGLIPFWSTGPAIGMKMINARSETAAQKSSFKMPLKKQRCLIPASGFYEWQKDGNCKKPYYFFSANNNTLAFAALWDKWKISETEIIYTFTILTKPANKTVMAYHNRMPVILFKEQYGTWLDTTYQNTDELTKIITDPVSPNLQVYEVSTFVNSPQNNTEKCIEPINSNKDQLF